MTIRESLGRLDQIARKHPELIAKPGEESSPAAWIETIKETPDMAARPIELEDSTPVNVRLSREMLEKIEVVAKKLKAKGLALSKSGGIRYLIEQGLRAEGCGRSAGQPG